MVEDSSPAVLLTQGTWQGLFSEVGEKLAVVELDEAVLSGANSRRAILMLRRLV